MKKLSDEILHTVIKPRPQESHKGTFGRVLLIGGNKQFGGAIMLASAAAVYSGAGLTTVATHPDNHVALHARLPEAMVIDYRDEPALLMQIKNADTVIIGPGLGLDGNAARALSLTLTALTAHQYLVIDGSAITLFAEAEELTLKHPSKTIFTPHQKEWERLSGLKIPQQSAVKNRKVADELGTNIVLKKHRTEVYLADGNDWQNPIGTPAMAIGGMGDTLAGIVGSFLAQFNNKTGDVLAAVYLHSYIGEMLAKEQYVVLPSQIIAAIPETMKKFEH